MRFLPVAPKAGGGDRNKGIRVKTADTSPDLTWLLDLALHLPSAFEERPPLDKGDFRGVLGASPKPHSDPLISSERVSRCRRPADCQLSGISGLILQLPTLRFGSNNMLNVGR